MKIPEKVKIGGYIYTVEFVDVVSKEKNLMGEIDYNNQVIRIDKSYSRQTQEATFIHELIHGILNFLGEHEVQENERMIDGIANTIYQIIKDNFER